MIGGPSADRDAREYFSRIEAEAKSIPNVEFLGFLPYREADKHFDDAVLFVNTADYEGFPNTFLQAWARGVPTVSFVDCNARDSFGPIGLIARDFTAMRDFVTRLAGDEAAKTLHGERCKQYFLANHSLPPVIERYRALFDRLSTTA
jgi:glycosyltransferase involved in cell wall biosynthesis